MERIVQSNTTQIISMTNLVTIGVETPRIDSKVLCSERVH